ncbi:hypothetical protein IAI10_24005 [Clostridium sp. 19966]|uniref:LPO_1073/Vpar_1526 family protein n=1 Tax=Clostridium sp. 19966 TaxID=2768166 RepID=UPI0028E08715|nr:LPO_1073/Vpar_1526 family protein [Clostridium sp. 19966]MDT8719704.1 hypothetical protein [Clostridium sp. 19966]
MIKGQQIDSGDDSTNIQGKDIVFIQNNGMTYSDVKEISMDVFKKNFYDLGQTIENIINERAEKILDKYLQKINAINPKLLQNTEEPDIRYNIYEVQKSHARRGDENIANLLVEMLVERTKDKDKSLKNLVLNEAMDVVPKLTSRQIDILSLIFLIRYIRYTGLTPIQNYIMVLIVIKGDINVTSDDMFYTHLQYSGCLSVSIGAIDFESAMEHKFPQINDKNKVNDMINSFEILRLLKPMWNNSKLCNSSLTSVGMAIAINNIQIKTGQKFDINIFIHE